MPSYLFSNGVTTTFLALLLYHSKRKLSLTIDEEILRKTVKRNAERHRKHLDFIKISEVYQMRKTMTDEEICKKLGVGKATFYLRLKADQR